jgi:hypothetical protein
MTNAEICKVSKCATKVDGRMDGWMDGQTPLDPFYKLSLSAELKKGNQNEGRSSYKMGIRWLL